MIHNDDLFRGCELYHSTYYFSTVLGSWIQDKSIFPPVQLVISTSVNELNKIERYNNWVR